MHLMNVLQYKKYNKYLPYVEGDCFWISPISNKTRCLETILNNAIVHIIKKELPDVFICGFRPIITITNDCSIGDTFIYNNILWVKVDKNIAISNNVLNDCTYTEAVNRCME